MLRVVGAGVGRTGTLSLKLALVLLLARDAESWCKSANETIFPATERARVPAQRLLEWRAGQGWAPICQRFGLPIPAEPFPHVNTAAEFNSRRAPE